ncbi:MAG: primosomal protein N' [Phycisphaerales bacterium]|nr:primosomal protein N' [Phycisphaerales bacterium]
MNTLFENASEATLFARVIPERGLDLRDGLTYAVPKELASLQVGERVIVPLGRGNRPTPGYVAQILDRAAAEADLASHTVKFVLYRAGEQAGEGTTRLTEPLMTLADWLSAYYCCPLGMVLGTMVPGAVKRGTGKKARTLINLAPAAAADREAAAEIKLPAGQRAVLDAALRSADLPCLRTELAERAGIRTIGPIKRLVERQLLVEVADWAVQARGEIPGSCIPDRPVTLNGDQQRVLDAITPMLDRFAIHLLYGVTGSGKTEIYLRLVEHILATGRDAIVLVPEIALTPQTVGRFQARFPMTADRPTIAILHSGLTAAQRHEQWARIAAGNVRVVVGARSAVFAPLPAGRLGLIVVDEEHDGSYKQDQLPRYHARDVAIRRAQIEGANVILGSATPSLESWHNAQNGRYQLHELTYRATGASLPSVDVVDYQAANRQRPRDGLIHQLTPMLEAALVETIQDEGQAILLLNRRGYANYICCANHQCGWLLTCDDCDTTMVYHRTLGRETVDRRSSGSRRPGVVRCHHCLAEKRLPEQCPQCGRKTTTFGFGTQRVELELARLFPDFTVGQEILRIDSDTMRRAPDYHDALGRFGAGEARILVGTQMIAKGLDFPNVRLVGIVNADTAINLPDFRAAERTFQLVSQVAGRSGRAEHPGRVVVQTMQPSVPAIRFAAEHDYRGFAEYELQTRRRAELPPITRMARIVIRDADHVKCYDIASSLAAALRRFGSVSDAVKQRGPMPCPISRVAGQHRQAIELIAPKASDLQRLLTEARNHRLLKADAKTAVDVDPIALL